MHCDFSKFVFGVGSLHINPESDFVALVPSGIKGREALFAALRRELRLPQYFGGNWDALSECLKDLSWIAQRRIIVLHEALPGLDPKTLQLYFSVLADAAQDWKPGESHELVIVFPEEARNEVARVDA